MNCFDQLIKHSIYLLSPIYCQRQFLFLINKIGATASLEKSGVCRLFLNKFLNSNAFSGYLVEIGAHYKSVPRIENQNKPNIGS